MLYATALCVSSIERERLHSSLFIKAVNGGAIDCVCVRLELISVD